MNNNPRTDICTYFENGPYMKLLNTILGPGPKITMPPYIQEQFYLNIVSGYENNVSNLLK